ncbi:Uncharacterised protein [Streptococcus equi subsp. equi]|nr:Uncharacterised protein [Streptococcus equi subsp. equi]
MAASAKLTRLDIALVIVPSTDSPRPAAVAKTPGNPLRVAAKAPTTPLALAIPLEIMPPNAPTEVPKLPKARPTFPNRESKGIIVDIALAGFITAQRAMTLGAKEVIFAFRLSKACSDNSPVCAKSPKTILIRANTSLTLAPNGLKSILIDCFSLANAATAFGIRELIVSKTLVIAGFRLRSVSAMVFIPLALAASSKAEIIPATPFTTAVCTFFHAVRIPPADDWAISANPPWASLSSIILSANSCAVILPSDKTDFKSCTPFLPKPKASAILDIKPGAASDTELNSSA